MSTPKFQEVLCCGGKRCPTVAVFDDGSAVVTDDESGFPQVIKFDPDQAKRLLEILKLQVGG